MSRGRWFAAVASPSQRGNSELGERRRRRRRISPPHTCPQNSEAKKVPREREEGREGVNWGRGGSLKVGRRREKLGAVFSVQKASQREGRSVVEPSSARGFPGKIILLEVWESVCVDGRK